MHPLRRPTRWFRGQGLRTRLHVRLRWATGPMLRVAGLVAVSLAPSGRWRVVDWGCGHGLLGLVLADLAAVNGVELVVDGTDIDPAKVASAEAAIAAAGLGDRLGARVVEPGDLPEGPVDLVVLDDVLYLMGPERQERLVRAAAAAVGPGGVVICKEMGAQPRWKARLIAAQERLTVGRLGVSATADGLGSFPPPERVAGWLAEEGLVTSTIPMDRWRHAPHVAVVGRRDGRLHA